MEKEIDMTSSDDDDNLAEFSVPDDLDEYAGQWIAQVRGKVIAHGDSVRDVLDSMPETEERPTIWRVPAIGHEQQNSFFADFDDKPTVCVMHKRFVPCRPCAHDYDQNAVTMRWSSEPADVEAVRRYHSHSSDEDNVCRSDYNGDCDAPVSPGGDVDTV